MSFRALHISGWQQFASLDIEFHDRLTVLTGANGSGKTTLLRFLARHFDWEFEWLRTPEYSKKGLRYLVRFLFHRSSDAPVKPVTIGQISYASGRSSALRIPVSDEKAATYQITIDQPESVQGFFLPSHRREFRYQRVENLPLRSRQWGQDAFSTVQQTYKNLLYGGGGYSSNYHIKEVLIGLAIFGYGSTVVEPDFEARSLYEDFQAVLRQILPPELGFQSISIRDRAEVVLVTRSGEFLLDAVSGGVAALFELAWQILMFSATDRRQYTVVIDEPENHLHAAMQRRLMPSFVDAFPRVQFVIATHSPLIVGSVRDSRVYALRFGEGYSVHSEELDLIEKAATAEQVLREVLDVRVTMPIWAEQTIESIVQEYVGRPLTVESAREMRAKMVAAGLERWVPAALAQVASDQSS